MAETTSLKKRPKNLDVVHIRLPLPGKVSILHRVSGFGLFVLLAPLIWLFQLSLASQEAFSTFEKIFFHPVVLAPILWAYLHHFCAGIRFLLLDAHIGIDLQNARRSAAAVLLVSIGLTALILALVFL
ncbi:MAG: succinate dehydrogenase, cytochrome b556 subunit [Zoogloeaceae bacterium]|jgi:succinate dehydrogenase / fumarate reductase cytochrome b subunit|nr:succinate dehydrogenase, cytochrome b556 subunit [Zoogloeaceae bacterium]